MLATAHVADTEQRRGREHHERDGRPGTTDAGRGRPPPTRSARGTAAPSRGRTTGDCHSMTWRERSWRSRRRMGNERRTGPSGLTAPSSVPPAAHFRHRTATRGSVPPSSRRPQPEARQHDQSQRERAVDVHPDPEDRQQHARAGPALGGQQREAEEHQPDQERAAAPRPRPRRPGPARRPRCGPRSVLAGPGELPDEPWPRSTAVSRPMSSRMPVGADRPGRARRRSSDASQLWTTHRSPAAVNEYGSWRGIPVEDEPAGRQVGEEAVVAEPVEPDGQTPQREAGTRQATATVGRANRRAPTPRRHAQQGCRNRLGASPVAGHAAQKVVADVDDGGADHDDEQRRGRCRTPSG